MQSGNMWVFEPRGVYVVGDTPSDIKAAKKLGFNSVAVTTGDYSLEELVPYTPTVILPDLRHFRSFFMHDIMADFK